MKFFKYALIACSSIAVLFILIPTIAFGILHYWILTPEFLTLTAKQALSEHTYLKFDCESIELDYLSSWPSISLAINKGKIELPNQEDSIITNGNLSFQKLHGNIQLSKLLTTHELQIENVFLQQPELNIKLGIQKPCLLKKKDQTTQTFPKVYFHINQIDINNADINISTLKKKQEFCIQNTSLSIKGNLFDKEPTFTITSDCEQIGGRTITSLLGNTFSLSLKGECQATEKFNAISFDNTSFWINQFPFQLRGNISNLKKKKETMVNLEFHLLASKLDEIIDFIPSQYLPQKSQYAIAGNTNLKGIIKGGITKSTFPEMKIGCQIDNGSILKKDINKGLDTISLNLDACYIPNVPDSCYINLNNTLIKGLNSFVKVQSRISNLQKSPFITADFNGFIDFDHIGKEFISKDITELNGKMESDLSVAFNFKDLKELNLSRIWINGIFNAPQVTVKSPQHNLDIFITDAKASIGYKKNKSNFIKNEDILSATINLDTLKMQYDKYIFLNLSQLNLRSNTALTSSSHASSPITAHINCKNLQAQMDNNRWINAQELEIHTGSKSFPINSNSEVACVIKANEIQYLDNKEQNAIAINNSDFMAELHPNNEKWDIKGLLNVQESQVYTSHYPIDIKVQKARVSFKNNQVSINHAQLNVGESDCILSGIVNVNENPSLDEPKIEGTLQLLGDYINYNELKKTLLYTEAAKKEFKVSNIQNIRISELSRAIKNSQSTIVQPEAFLIPKGIQLGLDINVNDINYEEIGLHQVSGDILIKDQKAYTQISTRSNFGKVNFIGLYDSKDKENIQGKFDINLQDILVTQIHRTIPTVGTIFPMVNSMSGLIDCHLTLSCQFDKEMLPILPTTEAICTIKGHNLTLIDHEVFKNIAKKLMFKNKEKNIIDQLSANFILQNNQIEVIPFQIKWDRYEAIVGGTHTTDFTYNYHVSLLKSPIPVDLGVNLSGKTSEMQYKLSKCKYKDLYKDNGTEHKRETEKRLNQKRKEIIKHIVL